MLVTFVELDPFADARAEYMDDEDYIGLQSYLMANPQAGTVVPRSGGCRKLRWMRPGMGKRGGLRVIYYLELDDGRIILVTLYSKSEIADIPGDVLRRILEKHQ
jgi:mRNA-degrading endonuclease RelE of RelBE toxin-antitoxin system